MKCLQNLNFIKKISIIFLGEQSISSYSDKELAKRRALVAQSSHLSFGFSSLEVVLMGRIPHYEWIETQKDIDIAHAALELCDVIHLKHRLYPTLSGGEQQRVQVARALAQLWGNEEGCSKYLFLDEATSNLDPAHQEMMMTIAQDRFTNRHTDQQMDGLITSLF